MKVLISIFFLFLANLSYGQFGLYASAVYINVNGISSFYNNTAPGLGQNIGSNTFQATDLGLFQQNSGMLKLVGAEIKTYKGTADNVCSGALNYTVYPIGSRPVSPVFNMIDLGFYSDCFAPVCGSFFGSFDLAAGGGCCSNRDQKWQNPGFGIAANIDLTAYPTGTYYLEMYYSYTGEDAGNGCGTTKYDNNNNDPANYTANFTITPTMPVSFGSIRVQNEQSCNNICWNTFSESATKLFYIERSANGINFYSIGELPAAGYSQAIKAYSFIDKAPLAGTNYYRIKMTGLDGKFQNSTIVSIKNGKKNNWHILTNPLKDNIQITGLENGDRIIIYNTYGSVVSNIVSKNDYLNIPVAAIANGAYFLKIINNKDSEVFPVIINH